MSVSHRRPRFCADITEDDFLQSMDTYLNGAYYPKYESLIARASRISEHDIGPFGELVSVVPFYLASRVPSYIPEGSESRIVTEREDRRSSGVFCFPLRADAGTGEYLQHNALAVLSSKTRAAYLSPLFIRKRNLVLLKNGSHTVYAFEDGEQKKSARMNAALLRETAVIIPHKPLEKAESPQYYSYTRTGEIVFHGDKAEKVQQKVFSAHDFILSVLGNKDDQTDAEKWIESIIEIMPEVFGQSASSRKLKLILEGTVLEHVDEAEFSAHPSVNKMLDSVRIYEKLVIIEKILRINFGITQYLKLTFRN